MNLANAVKAVMAGKRCEAIEREIEDLNRQLRNRGAEPESAAALANSRAEKEFAELRREKLIQQRIGLEIELARERLAEAETEYHAYTSASHLPLVEERTKLEARLREIDLALHRNAHQLSVHRRRIHAEQVLISALSEPQAERNMGTAESCVAALRERLLTL
jgi:hypothetical protein